MTATRVLTASPVPAALVLDADGRLLVADVERYLAACRRTAHPLLTATTQELVREALDAIDHQAPDDVPPPAPATALELELPRGLWRILPDWALTVRRPRGLDGVARLRITTARHLELTALVLEHYGWGQTQPSSQDEPRTRTPGGRRCILGAQIILLRLGYGTENTINAAGAVLDTLLRDRGVQASYHRWNDLPSTTREQAMALLRDAAAAARR
jgi:hypothetical protein